MLKKFLSKPATIKFSTYQHLIGAIPNPIHAKKAIPNWYKKLKNHVGKTSIVDGTAKRCIPMLEAFSQGYIIPLWVDVLVRVGKVYALYDAEDNKIAEIFHTFDPTLLVGEEVSDVEGRPVVARFEAVSETQVRVHCPFEKLAEDTDAIGGHGWDQVSDLCDLKKFTFGKTLLKFTNPWSIKTPQGWSCYFKNPSNDWSNEIQLLEGVVDTDTYSLQVNFPFVWTGTEQGEFFIEKGTPLVQVIPFKRTETLLNVSVRDEDEHNEMQKRLDTRHIDRYKHQFWHKRKKYDKYGLEA